MTTSQKDLRYDLTTHNAKTLKSDVPPTEEERIKFSPANKRYSTRKTISEAHKITKLHKHDTTSSYDKFPHYTQPYKLIPTTSTTHSVNNETPNIYPEGATLSNFIHEGRPTTTKLTYVAFPSSISHSTFHECSRGTPCHPQAFLHKHLTKLVVITIYFLHLERKIISQSIFTTRWNTTTESTQKKLIYSTSKKTTTFQVGIQSFNSLTKLT